MQHSEITAQFTKPLGDKISVIIPFYQVEAYIEECLQSVLNQTFANLEILLIDDCGWDRSFDIVQKYAQMDQRIKILRHTENRGLGEARNTGLAACSGQYIFFLDSDDFLELDILEKLYENIKRTKSDLVFCQAKAFTCENDGQFLNMVPDFNEFFKVPVVTNQKINLHNFQNFICRYPHTCWLKLYTLEFLKKNHIKFIKKNVIAEDVGFFLKVAAQFPDISVIDSIGLNYRIREKSITTTRRTKKIKNEHMKQILLDAFNYIKNYVSPKLQKPILKQIKSSDRFWECTHMGALQKIFAIGSSDTHNILKLFGFTLKFKLKDRC